MHKMHKMLLLIFASCDSVLATDYSQDSNNNIIVMVFFALLWAMVATDLNYFLNGSLILSLRKIGA